VTELADRKNWTIDEPPADRTIPTGGFDDGLQMVLMDYGQRKFHCKT